MTFLLQGKSECSVANIHSFTSTSFRASDVYAFGTVWYELLTGEWPWKHQPPESIIWQVGMGMKPSLANLAASKEVKDVLMHCWLHSADHRPGFPDIAAILEKMGVEPSAKKLEVAK